MDLQNTSNAGGQSAKFANHRSKGQMQDCIQECLRCHQTCQETLQYCIQQGGRYVDPHHLKALQTCIVISHTAASFMMLQSPFHNLTCEVCGHLCRACARSCAELDGNDLRACAEICLACAETCEEMAGLKD